MTWRMFFLELGAIVAAVIVILLAIGAGQGEVYGHLLALFEDSKDE